MLVKETTGKAEKRVDPRVRRTRELIVRAFDELVAEKGHTGLTVQEIAGRATINRATFYAHFADQYELFDYASTRSLRVPEGSQHGMLADGPAVQATHRVAGAGRALRALAGVDRSGAGEDDRPAGQPGGYGLGGKLVDLRGRVGLEP